MAFIPNMYDFTVVPYTRLMKNLLHILTKAEKWADDNNVPHSDLLEASLAPDMKSLPFQVWSVSDHAKAAVWRMLERDNIVMENNQNTFSELQDRIKKTIEYLETTKREDYVDREFKETTWRTFTFKNLDYIALSMSPNFYFHLTTAYAILRMKGVPLGKLDYMTGGVMPNQLEDVWFREEKQEETSK